MKKVHIEYDDFGEYMEIMDDDTECEIMQVHETRREHFMTNVVKKLFLVLAAPTVMFSTTSYASGTCQIKGCYKSTVYGGSYCKNHTCSKSGCKNLAVDGTYCSEHQKKTYGSSSSSGSTTSKTCSVSGCNKPTTGGSAYC